jgi:hypothetical protein
MPASDDLDEAELEAIKAVKSYETYERRVAAFESDNREIFEGYDAMLEELERKRQVADALIRKTDATFGPWERFSEQRSYDVQALYTLLGKEKFLALGGTETEMPVIEFERKLLELQIKKRAIPASIVSQIVNVTSKYRAPKPKARS